MDLRSQRKVLGLSVVKRHQGGATGTWPWSRGTWQPSVCTCPLQSLFPSWFRWRKTRQHGAWDLCRDSTVWQRQPWSGPGTCGTRCVGSGRADAIALHTQELLPKHRQSAISPWWLHLLQLQYKIPEVGLGHYVVGYENTQVVQWWLPGMGR